MFALLVWRFVTLHAFLFWSILRHCLRDLHNWVIPAHKSLSAQHAQVVDTVIRCCLVTGSGTSLFGGRTTIPICFVYYVTTCFSCCQTTTHVSTVVSNELTLTSWTVHLTQLGFGQGTVHTVALAQDWNLTVFEVCCLPNCISTLYWLTLKVFTY